MTMRIADAFERVVVVNLDRRPDRLAKVKVELDRLGIPFERVSAADGRVDPTLAAWRTYAAQPLVEPPQGERVVSSYREFYLGDASARARVAFVEQRSGQKAIATAGAFGLLLSMTRVVERALSEGWQSLLILEDDVLFHRDTPALFDAAWRQLPADWVVLQLGVMQLHWEEDWIAWWSDNLYRCYGSSIGAHAVGLRRKALEPLLEACREQDLPFDIGALHRIKRRFREQSFTIYPNLAIQDAADTEIGMSTVFFREARKVDNLYRWHLPDYGPAAKPASKGAKPRMALPRMARRPFKLGSLRDALGATIERLASRLQAAADASAAAAAGRGSDAPVTAMRRGPAPLRARLSDRPHARCVLAVVVGLAPDQLDDLVERLAAAPATVPIFLTDADRFDVFRRHRAVFEYLPAIAPADDLDVELYRLRRLALLRRKWQPVKIIAFGAEAARLVRAWRGSPFEDRGIDALTGGREQGA